MNQGWALRPLGDVAEVIAGQSPEGSYYNATQDGLPFYQGKRDFGEKFIGAPTTWTTQVTKVALQGDVLMSVRAPVGPVNFATEMCCIGRGLAAIRCGSELDRNFLLYFLRSKQDEIGGTEGAVFASINKNQIQKIELVIPPLAEQRRIVATLDEGFDGIATASANTELNRRHTLNLFERHLSSSFAGANSWPEKRLREVAESISTGPFGTMLHKSDYVADGIPLVNPMNIVDSQIVPSNKMMVNEATRDRLAAYVLRAGDVVVGRRGELGRCALVTDREAGWLCGTGSFFVRLSDVMLAEFFVALFGSREFKARLESRAVGSTMSSLNHAILNDLALPVPPLTEQQMIVERIHELRTETQHLSALYERKLRALEALKKALLHQAFLGELRDQAA